VVIIRTAEGGRNAVTDTVIVRFEGDGAYAVALSAALVDASLGDTAEGGSGAVPAMDAVR
jgi:hypothetical protein